MDDRAAIHGFSRRARSCRPRRASVCGWAGISRRLPAWNQSSCWTLSSGIFAERQRRL